MSAAGSRRPERTHRRPDPTSSLRTARWPLVFALPLLAAVMAVPLVTATGTPESGAAAPVAARADLIRSREWSLTALHVPQAWRWSKGAGVTVAVLDTGVDGRHPDLVGRVIQGPDYTGHGRRPGNRYWGRHGTAMASIIAGHGHGPGHAAGVIGVAPLAKILSIRVTWENDDPERSDQAQVDRTRDAVAKGIRYAVDHGAQIINMSLGGGTMVYNGNPVEEDAVRYALGKGAMLIASAGNDGAGPNRTNFPAAYPGVTAVGAVDKALRPAGFTNRHAYVSVAAPGVDIISADVGRSYVEGTGTSPSAALVAGIAALVRSRCPSLTPDQARLALERGVTHRPPAGRDTKVGTGVADALRAMYAGNRLCQTPPPPRPQSQPKPEAAGASLRAHATPPLIAVLGGGALLLIIGLMMGWRQRARRTRGPATKPYQMYEVAESYAGRDAPAAPPRAAAQSRMPPARHTVPRTAPRAMPRQAPRTEATRAPARRAADPQPRHHDRPDTHRPGLLSAPVVLPAQPREPARRGEPDFGDDPLGTGSNVPLLEGSTPLADQSWEIVQRGRQGRDLGPPARPAEPDGGAAPPATGAETTAPFDFLRLESRDDWFRPPGG
ncbi:MAG TPA: S8 family serine peptidase [Streptosporangiaceae bacterium]